MAMLVVKLHGEEVFRIRLESGGEYVAGRGQDAQIQLGEQRGISRHHLKFYEREGAWVVESLSKFGLIQKGEESMATLELSENIVFTVPPYEFVFSIEVAAASAPEPSSAAGDNLPAVFQPRVNPPAADGATSGSASKEATVIADSSLTPYFRISYPNTTDDEVLRLEGSLWVAGRDPDCEIRVDSPHISRKHFELARTQDGYFLTDLGSANGTKVNGQRLAEHEPTRIESGDEIRVMNIAMTLEIRDPQFAKRLSGLPVPVFDSLLAGAPAGAWFPPASSDAGVAEAEGLYAHGEAATGKKGWRGRLLGLRKNKVRLALVVLAPLVLLLALLPDKPKENSNPRGPASPTFETLSEEKKLVVKDSFNLARNLYVQGKYALCLTELAKLHELIPQYENSKELQSFCEQGLELVRRQEDMDRKDRERAQIEAQISNYVETCKAKLSATATVDEIRQCLAPAIELAPEHPLVIEMINSAQMHADERKFMAGQKKVQDAKTAKGVAHFNRAMATYKKGHLWHTIGELEKFIATTYPNTDELKDKARREIASIKVELKTKVSALVDKCKGLAAKSKFKEAYLACDQALSEDPTLGEAKDLRAAMLQELHRVMKSIYEDSVLEESLGNVDTAKEKWKKIIQEDLPNDDYTKKATSKLQKYGVIP